jgi:uncharacterized cupin superfamily protein
VDFLLITYPPGATSSSRGGQMRHSGAEFGFVLRGELVLTLGFDEVRLGPGDAVSFPSTTPHSYRNDGTEPAVGVWFVIERDVHVDDYPPPPAGAAPPRGCRGGATRRIDMQPSGCLT